MYKDKYLKYKNKYLNSLIGGASTNITINPIYNNIDTIINISAYIIIKTYIDM
jgi:hypothetical protein